MNDKTIALKQQILQNLDYFILPENTWKVFLSHYNVDYEVCIDLNGMIGKPDSSDLFLEVQPGSEDMMISGEEKRRSSISEIPNELSIIKKHPQKFSTLSKAVSNTIDAHGCSNLKVKSVQGNPWKRNDIKQIL